MNGSGEEQRRVRLNRFLASCGLASRRHVEALIAGGEVAVDGQPATDLATWVDPEASVVTVAGEPVRPGHRRTYLLNKPRGVICTNAPGQGKRRAVDLIPGPPGMRLFCVGRLDEESEGLILVTNDGELANLVAHPRYGVPKTYSVTVRGSLTTAAMAKIQGGVWLAEGRTGRARLQVRRRSHEATALLITIQEGRNREVRRLFARVGFPVQRLKRVRIGRLTIHKLKPGGWRPLTPAEVAGLRDLARGGAVEKEQKKPCPRRGSRRRS